MRNLVHPVPPYFDWYVSIAEAKNLQTRRTLTQIGTQVRDTYTDYVKWFRSGQLHRLRPSRGLSVHKTILEDCYDIETQPLIRLKASIREAQLDFIAYNCQYCDIDSSDTWDHYIPKSSFPEFAVLGLNLIPSCGTCNNKKNQLWKKRSERVFLNLYTDRLPKMRFLFCRIDMSGGAPSARFSLHSHQQIPPQLFSIIRHHFKQLDLIRRYNRKSSDEIHQTLASLKPLPKSITEYRRGLREIAAQRQRDFGRNYWRAVLQLGLSDSDEFLRWAKGQ